MKYATFDENNVLITRLIGGSHAIPETAVLISEEIFKRSMLETDGIWKLVNGEVVKTPFPAPALADLQAAAWERIKAERERRTRTGGYLVGDKWFHSDPDSRIQQLGLVLMGANIPEDLQWKAMDGSFVAMTQTLASQIFAAAAISDQVIFAKAEEHNALMLASPTPETYDHLTGWPKVYGE